MKTSFFIIFLSSTSYMLANQSFTCLKIYQKLEDHLSEKEILTIHELIQKHTVKNEDYALAGLVVLPLIHLKKFHRVIPLKINEERMIYLSTRTFTLKVNSDEIHVNTDSTPLTTVLESTIPFSAQWVVLYDARHAQRFLIKEEFKNPLLEKAHQTIDALLGLLKLK